MLPLYDKYKKKESFNDSLDIACRFGKLIIHSIECAGEQVINRKSSKPDKNACEKCFNSKTKLKFMIVSEEWTVFYLLKIT